ncbi:hypothetical protein ACFL6S_03530 [Candidatus Poribacteria bacterium]
MSGRGIGDGFGKKILGDGKMDKVREVIKYHKEFFDPELLRHETIASELWPLVTDRITIKADDPPSARSIIHKKILIEGMALHVARLWDNLVVEDMILLFAQNTEKYCESFAYGLEQTIARDEGEAILVGKEYLDFRSFSNIISFSKKHLVDALDPFRKLSHDQRYLIDELMIVRNHIAHRSKKSLGSYKKLLAGYDIQIEKEPGYFLLYVPGQEDQDKIMMYERHGKKRIFMLYIEALRAISNEIVEYLEAVV